MEPKKIGLFDDDDDGDDGDDGDLFGAKLKSKNERKTDLFGDEDDLFVSSKGQSSVEKSRSIKSKSDASKDVPILDVPILEEKSKDDTTGNRLFSNTTKTNSLLFEDDDYDDLFGKKETAVHENVQSKPESKEEVKEDSVKDAQELPQENKSSVSKSLSADRDAKTSAKANIVVSRAENDVNDKKSKADIEEPSNAEEDVDGTARKSPPKTLNIRTTPSPSSEESSQAPRKSVSGKIKNLMGKMGDLKILSPMDAPPLWRKSEEKTDEDEDVVDRDSDNGGQTVAGRVSPPSSSVSGKYPFNDIRTHIFLT